MENELVRAELEGLSGSGAAYRTLLDELDVSLAALGRCAEEAEEAGEAASASASALAGAMADAARCYWNLGLLDEARELYEDGLRVLVRLHGGNCEHGDGDGDGDGNIINVQGHGHGRGL